MKRIFALLLALTMVFCLAACGESETPAPTTTAPTTAPNPIIPNPPADLKPVAMGLSVADVTGLLELLAGAAPELDIKDLFVEIAAGDERGVLSLGATMLDEKHVAQLFFGEAIVLSAPTLLDKNYGASMDKLMDMMEDMTGAAMPSTPATGMLENLDPEMVANLLSKYYDLLLDELKKADGITATTADGKTVITGTLNADACATILVKIVDTLCNDNDFFTLMGQITGQGDEFKTGFLDGYPGADSLLADLKEAMNEQNICLKLNNLTLDSSKLPVAADLAFTATGIEVALAYDFAKGTMSGLVKMNGEEIVSVTVADNKLDASMIIDGQKIKVHMEITDNGLNAYVEMQDEKVFELVLTFSSTEIKLKLKIGADEYVLVINMSDTAISGNLSLNGQVMGALSFDKKVEGTKTTLTLKTLEISSTTIDFSKLGICLYIDTAATLPAAPTDYVDATTLTETDLQNILEKFMTDNQDLVDMFTNAFGGQEGDVTIDSSNSYYAA